MVADKRHVTWSVNAFPNVTLLAAPEAQAMVTIVDIPPDILLEIISSLTLNEVLCFLSVSRRQFFWFFSCWIDM